MDGDCRVVGDKDYSKKLTDIYSSGMQRMADNLLHGTLSLEDWHKNMKDAIRQMYAYQAAAGVNGDQSQMRDDDWTRIQDNIGAQYAYLDNFAADIEKAVETEGASLDFIPNRATLYAKSAQAEFWRQATDDADLPAYPGDGTSECLGQCGCEWVCINGKWHWQRGKDDSCTTCIEREQTWNPYNPDNANLAEAA